VVAEAQGGYAIWIQLPPGADAFKLYYLAMKKQISIAPGQLFSSDARYSNFIRISFGALMNEQIKKGIITLGQLIKNML
jgi:DNA-binding transcriptional MocR family regulator